MNGKRFILLFLCSVGIFTAALFYFQNYAYYDSIDIRQDILIGNKRYEISYYRGIDSESSGLKLRECFVVDSLDDINLPKYKKPTPLTAPFWFECFDAERITKDLENGKATAFLFKKRSLTALTML